MADKLMYPIGSFKYANRMLKSGDDPVLMSARDQRLYVALGKVVATPPARTAARPAPAPAAVVPAAKPKPKRATRRRAAKKK